MARVYVVEVPKGGSAKTTTAQNLASYYAKQGKRTLGIDIDGQASWSQLQGLFPRARRPTLYTALKQLIESFEARLPIYKTPSGLHFIPASSMLHQVVSELSNVERREYVLKQLLAPVMDRYDVIIIDTPPSLNPWTNNALVVADAIIIPTQVEPLGIASAGMMLEHLQKIRKRGLLEKDLMVSGAILTMMDSRTVLHRDMATIATQELGTYIHFFDTRIERSIQFPEAQFLRQSIEAYSPRGKGATAYGALAEEIWAGTHQVRVEDLEIPVGFADSLLQAATAAEDQDSDEEVAIPWEEVDVH